jgi:hypothetical protein
MVAASVSDFSLGLVFLLAVSGIVAGFVNPHSLTTSNKRQKKEDSHTVVLRVISYPTHFASSFPSFNDENNNDKNNVYIPLDEVEETLSTEKRKHEQECLNLQKVIEEQRRQLSRLKETERKERLRNKMHHDACTNENLTMLWSENHQTKLNRFQGQLEYLQDENEQLQEQLRLERTQHGDEITKLQVKLEEQKEKTKEAKEVLGLERAYFETSVKLLEAGLERETQKVKSLQEQLAAKSRQLERRKGNGFVDPLPLKTRQTRQQQRQQQTQQQNTQYYQHEQYDAYSHSQDYEHHEQDHYNNHYQDHYNNHDQQQHQQSQHFQSWHNHQNYGQNHHQQQQRSATTGWNRNPTRIECMNDWA